MTENQETIVNLVLAQMKPSENIDEDSIKKLVDFFKSLNPISVEEEKEVIHELHSVLSIRMDVGACVTEKNHLPWYDAAKKDISPTYWNRYRRYLKQNEGFNSDVINALDASTDKMMDMLGNPNSSDNYSRKGLVIGDVQSGKTSTYTALINKAADAGYKIVILLTGTIEKLRRQTQSRLDEGFIGLDSTAFTRDKEGVIVGVGKYDKTVSAWAVTSTSKDFNTSIAQSINGKLSSINAPILFVLKKNKSVLEKLEQWLRLYNADQNTHTISIPMLLIDDEADNASVNTKKEDDSPTAINAGIRKLLKLFTRSNYVGFTATPYANIFINPDSEDEMLSDDLFPKDFIYALEAPTNYIGARSIFSTNGKYNFMLKNNDDCEKYLPVKHNKEEIPGSLPNSLKEAVASFFIANAIRDIRGYNKKHRSMLVNISKFIDVQNRIAIQLDGFVREYQREIKLYSKTKEKALSYKRIRFIKTVYDNHFAPLNSRKEKEDKIPSWETVLDSLSDAIAPIVVRSVNGGNAAKNLNYDENEEEGLRLIAVGGVSLSRGLTLEGLCVSYYHRNTKMYDTLMQMGRWFGYRPHYADLCQVWMSQESADWYEYISEASDELRREVRKMDDLGLTPKDFGLGVRSDIDTLLVTAINKMRNTEELVQSISLAGEVVETPYLFTDKKINDDNKTLILNWINELIKSGFDFSDNEKEDLALRKNLQIRNIPKNKILELLQAYKSHYRNIHFRTSDLVQLIKKYSDGTVDKWDLVIATGLGDSMTICGHEINVMQRSFLVVADNRGQDSFQMSGSKSRLGTNNLSRGGLTRKEYEAIKEKAICLRSSTDDPDRELTANEYFRSGLRRNPLIVIYPVQLKEEIGNENSKIVVDYRDEILFGLSVGIPSIDGKRKETYNYVVNMIKWKEQQIVDADEDQYEETGVEDDDDFGY